MNYTGKTEPKEVKRNTERKSGVMKIIAAFAGMLETSSEISHDSAKRKMRNFTNWMVNTADGITDLGFSESNYQAYDEQEREIKELKERNKED